MSITPQQAYEAAKVLWPDTSHIRRASSTIGFIYSNRTDYIAASVQPIDWGDTDQYPLPEPEWVDAVMPDDWGKEARFGHDKKEWSPGMISGYSALPDRSFRWWSGFSVYKFCQVRKVKT
jgi:hypothetical protein